LACENKKTKANKKRATIDSTTITAVDKWLTMEELVSIFSNISGLIYTLEDKR
jgi:hypothetical protein